MTVRNSICHRIIPREKPGCDRETAKPRPDLWEVLELDQPCRAGTGLGLMHFSDQMLPDKDDGSLAP